MPCLAKVPFRLPLGSAFTHIQVVSGLWSGGGMIIEGVVFPGEKG